MVTVDSLYELLVQWYRRLPHTTSLSFCSDGA